MVGINNAKYIVEEVKKGQKKRTPAPPFTTSTMQQEASRKLGFTLKKTMSIAQGLYAGDDNDKRKIYNSLYRAPSKHK